MNAGYACPLEGQEAPEGIVIGVVVAQKFAEPKTIIENVQRGVEAYPDATWVIRGRPKSDDASRHVVSALADLDRAPVFAEGNPFWLSKDRGSVRDEEMMNYCSQVIVFHDPNSPTTKVFQQAALGWRDDIHVITRGKTRKKSVKRKRPE